MERSTPSQKRKATVVDSTPPIEADKKIRRLSIIGFVPVWEARDAPDGGVTPPHVQLTEARIARLVMAPRPRRSMPARDADRPIPDLVWH